MTWTQNKDRDVAIIKAVLAGASQSSVAERFQLSRERIRQIMDKFERRRRWVEHNRGYYMDENFDTHGYRKEKFK